MAQGENEDLNLVPITGSGNNNLLSRAEFQKLSDVPPETVWFANIDNPRTRRAYMIDLRDFMAFVGIGRPEEFRVVSRAHVIAWRKSLEGRGLGGATIRRKLAALSSIYAGRESGRRSG